MSDIEIAMARARALTPDPAERAAMYAWVLGWIAQDDPELFLRAMQEWRRNRA